MANSGQGSVLPSAEFISKRSKDVSISTEGVNELATHLHEALTSGKISTMNWMQNPLNPKVADEHAVKWIFVVDTLNFCFWFRNQESKFVVDFEGKQYSGYWSLCAAVNRALKEGYDLTDPSVLSKITIEDLKHIFRSANEKAEIPILESRLEVLHEAGKVVLERFDGSIMNLLKEANNSAVKAVQLLADNFKSYCDKGVFEGREVTFYKRAQIFVADVWACFEGKSHGRFDDIDEITMFADYRVPQTLCYFKVLEYSESLNKKLKEGIVMENGSREEMEIRAASIYSVELVKRKLNELLAGNTDIKPANAILIDFYLWDYAQDYKQAMSVLPIHYTYSVFY